MSSCPTSRTPPPVPVPTADAVRRGHSAGRSLRVRGARGEDREKAREWLKAHPFPPVVDRLSSAFPGFFGPSVYPGEVERGPSFIRRLLGDVPVTEVGVPASASAEEKKSVHSLFPETYVEESDRGPG